MKNHLSLYELNQKIKYGLEALFPFPVWIVAEISEIQSRQHCYLELVERDKAKEVIVAKSRATIWARTYNLLKPYFETSTGYELSEGLKVLVQVEIQFSELYGLSLNIKDIEPNYTLGDLEKRKQQIIQQLKEEGIYEMNKALLFPDIPKNIAIISSEKAAGYQDFLKQLHKNHWGYQFHTKLFPALMQGKQAEETIIKALEQIYEYENIFDAVVVIRGGGAVSDLSCFDNYKLAANIAQFPLPILTGIGHDKDQSVADEVAYRSLKTPTAVADYLINCFQNCEDEILNSYDKFSNLLKMRIVAEKQALTAHTKALQYSLPASLKDNHRRLTNVARDFQYLLKERIAQAKNQSNNREAELYTAVAQYHKDKNWQMTYMKRSVVEHVTRFLVRKQRILQHKGKINELLSPQRLLKRGYSITTCKGKIVKDASLLSKNAEIVTQVSKGKFKSIVK